jgi:homoserine kinase
MPDSVRAASHLRAASVRVPASTSNLGAGFDCVGLAFGRYLHASFEPSPSGALELERRGTLMGLTEPPDRDIVCRAFLTRLAAPPAGRIIVDSTIPIGYGLGSSGAAAVAGVLLALAASDEALDDATRATLLCDAVALEGHPDNAAPALFGGLVAVTRRADGSPRALRMPLAAELAFVFAAPDRRIATAAARTALPALVAHDAAARSLHRVTALLHGLATADAELLRIGFADELHVPFRLPLIPRAAEAIAAAGAAGAWAATISGSGSGIVAVCEHATADAVRHAMHDVFADGLAFVCEPDLDGAVVNP